ncbi:MAG: trigger factor [Stomatobaculum sp.]|nr:trigger factor [Stomatobaculum sp.]
MRKSMKKAAAAAGIIAGALILASCGKKPAETTAAATTAAAAETTTAAAPAETTAAAETQAETVAEPDNYGTVTLGDYKGVDVEVHDVNVTDDDVKDYADSLVSYNPVTSEVDRAAKEGDTVNIDYVGKKDGVAFDGGTAQGYDLTLGSNTFIDGFESGLIGVKKGDKVELNLTFPEDYGNADLAGQSVVFEVTVNGVKETVDAVLNDEWVQNYSGGDQNTVDEFLAAVKEELQEQAEQNEYASQLNNLITTIADNATIDVNPEAIEYEAQKMIESSQNSLAQYGIDLDSYLSMVGMSKDEYEEQMRSNGEEYAKIKLLVQEIAEKEGLDKLTDADYKAIEEKYGYSKQMLIQMAGQEAVDFETLYMKVSDYLPENANKVEAPAEEKAEEEEQADVPEVEADQADAGEETEAAKQ